MFEDHNNQRLNEYLDTLDCQFEKQERVEQWVDANGDDYEDEFALEFIEGRDSLAFLMTAGKHEAENFLREQRGLFQKEFDVWIESKAAEELGL